MVVLTMQIFPVPTAMNNLVVSSLLNNKQHLVLGPTMLLTHDNECCSSNRPCNNLVARKNELQFLSWTSSLSSFQISSLGDQSSGNKVFCSDTGLQKISTSRVKLCLNPAFHKVKNVLKRVRAYYEQIMRDAPSQRKAKHDYIDCCQGMVGYGCRFFRVKVRSDTVMPNPNVKPCKTKSKEKKKQKNVSFFFSLETLDFTIRIDSTPTFLYFDLYL